MNSSTSHLNEEQETGYPLRCLTVLVISLGTTLTYAEWREHHHYNTSRAPEHKIGVRPSVWGGKVVGSLVRGRVGCREGTVALFVTPSGGLARRPMEGEGHDTQVRLQVMQHSPWRQAEGGESLTEGHGAAQGWAQVADGRCSPLSL